MTRHPALQSLVSLRRAFVTYADGEYNVIATVGEALNFLVKLPAKLDGLHWALASNGLCWAHRSEVGINHATEAFEHALRTDGLFVRAAPSAQ